MPIGGEPLLLPPPVYSDKERESSVVRLNIIIINIIKYACGLNYATPT